MQRIDGPKIIFNCPQVLVDRVEKLATHLGVTRAEVIRIMLETSCDGFEPFMKLGVLRKMMAQKSELSRRISKAMQPTIC